MHVANDLNVSLTGQAKQDYLNSLFSKSRLRDSTQKALIVEDDPFSQKYFQKVLHDRFPDLYTVVTEDYDSALNAILREGKFDIVILDIYLGGDKDGIDIYRTLLRLHHKPVIVMTSALEPERYLQLFPRGIQAPPFLKKPFRPDECTAIIKDVSGIMPV